MGWSKKPIKIPLVSDELDSLLSTLSGASSTLESILGTASSALDAAKVLYLAKSDPFVFILGELLDELEEFINDFFAAGIYYLEVSPYELNNKDLQYYVDEFGQNISNIDAALERDSTQVEIEYNNLLKRSDVSAKILELQQKGGDELNKYLNSLRALAEKNLYPSIDSSIELAGSFESALEPALKKSGLYELDPLGIPLVTPKEVVRQMVKSFDDPGDENRPIFSDDANVASFGFIISAPSPQEFVTLATSFLNIFEVKSLRDFLNDVNKKLDKLDESNSPIGDLRSRAPDWNGDWRLENITYLSTVKTSLLRTLELIRGYTVTADKAFENLIDMISAKINDLLSIVEDLTDLIERIRSALDATGIYVFALEETVGGVDAIKRELQVTVGGKRYYANGDIADEISLSEKARSIRLDDGEDIFNNSDLKYSYGFLIAGGGVTASQVDVLRGLFLDTRTTVLVSGENARNRMNLGGIPYSGTLSFQRANDRSINIEMAQIVAELESQNRLNPDNIAAALERAVAQENNNLPGFTESIAESEVEDDTLQLTIIDQGADGRTPQPAVVIPDGANTLQSVAFSNAITTGTWSLENSSTGQVSSLLDSSSTARDIEIALNLIAQNEFIPNQKVVSVTGDYASGFGITLKDTDVEFALSSNTTGETIGVTTDQLGNLPGNNLFDINGNKIDISVEQLAEGRYNDPCED